ncbi:MAG: multidrug efflux SMR transporter [Candidatus Gastranaerophilales bacterium]|nr:multidrug efflux SMR transporter [Candidatus Gastranaerophilales bacterium]
MILSWIYLLAASIFEVGWPVGLKMAEITNNKVLWIIFAIIAMTLSGVFLYFAQKHIPIGTAYAVWTGIGAACTFIIGVMFFQDSMSLIRLLGIALIISGVVCLKFGH